MVPRRNRRGQQQLNPDYNLARMVFEMGSAALAVAAAD
jgi:hypothetical protein